MSMGLRDKERNRRIAHLRYFLLQIADVREWMEAAVRASFGMDKHLYEIIAELREVEDRLSLAESAEEAAEETGE